MCESLIFIILCSECMKLFFSVFLTEEAFEIPTVHNVPRLFCVPLFVKGHMRAHKLLQYCRLFRMPVVIRPCVLPEEAYHSSYIFLYQLFGTPVIICSCVLPEEAYHYSYIIYLVSIIFVISFLACWLEGELCGPVVHASPSHPGAGYLTTWLKRHGSAQ